MQKLLWRTSINITSNYAPLTMEFSCFHLSAQYSKEMMISWGEEGTNEGEKKELVLPVKLVFGATCPCGGAFVFNSQIHPGAAITKSGMHE